MTTETIIIALIAMLAGSTIKSISGMGLPMVAIPVITIVEDVETAVAVIALPNLLINATMAWRARDTYPDTRDLPVLGLTGFAGGVIGTLVLVSWDEKPLVAGLVVIVAIYVVMFVGSPDLRIGPSTSRRWAPTVGTTAGLLQGAVGISGPLVGSWIHSYRLERRAHILSVTTMFTLSGVSQLITFLVRGDLDGRWTVALLGCVPALATIPLGERLRDRFSSDGFDRLVVGTITVTITALAIRTFV